MGALPQINAYGSAHGGGPGGVNVASFNGPAGPSLYGHHLPVNGPGAAAHAMSYEAQFLAHNNALREQMNAMALVPPGGAAMDLRGYVPQPGAPGSVSQSAAFHSGLSNIGQVNSHNPHRIQVCPCKLKSVFLSLFLISPFFYSPQRQAK
jgi:hypothetical protein